MDPTILVAAGEFRDWAKRRKALRKHALDAVEGEGGTVESMGMIGMLLRSPFPPVNIRPVYLRIRCRYAADRGSWYLCGAQNGIHWVWASATGAQVPPVKREYPVRVDNGVLALPPWASVLLYLAGLGALAGGFAWLVR